MNKYRGNETEIQDGLSVYCDTHEVVKDRDDAKLDRPCGVCGLSRTPEGHDGCLGTLPGVMNACCGHGEDRLAYVQFWNKDQTGQNSRIAGDEALVWIEANKTGNEVA